MQKVEGTIKISAEINKWKADIHQRKSTKKNSRAI